MTIVLTDEQNTALEDIKTWALGTKRVDLTLGGYAGTGKTTLIKEVVKTLSPHFVISVCALSGKAAHVLQSKGIQASTIHKLIYIPRQAEDGKVEWDRREKVDAKLFIVDEASMVNRSIYKDILSFGGRVLWVGDHGQLEPIGDNPGLMLDPQIKLETIMRQALESPILRLAHQLRMGETLAYGSMGEGCETHSGMTFPVLLAQEADQIIVGTNETRHRINAAYRVRKKLSGLINEGERVICLRNNYILRVFNGMQCTVKKIHETSGNSVYCDLVDDYGNEITDVRMNASQFGANPLPVDPNKQTRDDSFAYFDYAYAITCHKAQGSEWNKVVVFEQIAGSWDQRRWSYTAATRAKKALIYVRKPA